MFKFKKSYVLIIVLLICGVVVLAGLDNITRAEGGGPDLTVESIDFSYITGESYNGQLNITICTRGDVSYNLNCDNEKSLLEITRVGYFTSSISECGNIDISPDECREYETRESFSNSESYTFEIKVDPENNISESNENNNILRDTKRCRNTSRSGPGRVC